MSDQQKIYDQDCQFLRYQDGFMWSRLQTAAAVEAGMLYGLYGHGVDLVPWEKGAAAVLGFFFVLAICCLMWSDRSDGQDHMVRIEEFEKLSPYVSSKPRFARGQVFLCIAVALLNGANIAIMKQVFWAWMRFFSPGFCAPSLRGRLPTIASAEY